MTRAIVSRSALPLALQLHERSTYPTAPHEITRKIEIAYKIGSSDLLITTPPESPSDDCESGAYSAQQLRVEIEKFHGELLQI